MAGLMIRFLNSSWLVVRGWWKCIQKSVEKFSSVKNLNSFVSKYYEHELQTTNFFLEQFLLPILIVPPISESADKRIWYNEQIKYSNI